jgi:Protein of unknown function (DUF2934)
MQTSDDLAARIHDRAYEIWQGEGCPEGCAERHWAEAEAEIRHASTAQDADTSGAELQADGQERKARASRHAG